jgi:hypothetical protein
MPEVEKNKLIAEEERYLHKIASKLRNAENLDWEQLH